MDEEADSNRKSRHLFYIRLIQHPIRDSSRAYQHYLGLDQAKNKTNVSCTKQWPFLILIKQLNDKICNTSRNLALKKASIRCVDKFTPSEKGTSGCTRPRISFTVWQKQGEKHENAKLRSMERERSVRNCPRMRTY